MNKDYSSLIIKYNAKLKKNPASPVFAPLAEIYIKMGQYDDALSVLRQGLEHNPKSIFGYICLAECYKERAEHELSFATLKPLISSYPENLRLQRLFADAAYNTGKYDEALEAYKRILFLNPRDEDVALIVKKLEDYINKPPVLEDGQSEEEIEQSSTFFCVDNLDHTKLVDDFSDWVQMDLTEGKQESAELETEEDNYADDYHANLAERYEVQEREVENREVEVEVEVDVDKLTDSSAPSDNEQFFYTVSMLDIYMGQQLWVKAKELVVKLIEEAPQDQLELLKEKEQIINDSLQQNLDNSVSDGDQLMDIYDKKVAIQEKSSDELIKEEAKKAAVKAKLLKFIDRVKEESQKH